MHLVLALPSIPHSQLALVCCHFKVHAGLPLNNILRLAIALTHNVLVLKVGTANDSSNGSNAIAC
jgi:hypothetical protein